MTKKPGFLKRLVNRLRPGVHQLSLQEQWAIDDGLNEQVSRIVHSQCFTCEHRIPYHFQNCMQYKNNEKPEAILMAKAFNCPYYEKEKAPKVDEEKLKINW